MQSCFVSRGAHGFQILVRSRGSDRTPDCCRSQGRRRSGGPTGIWLTQAGDAKVRVSKCGGGLCGVIVWLKEPIDPATGKRQVDDKNPNPALARRPMIGLPLFSGMRASGPNKWSGQIYNADDGKSYESHISVSGPIRCGSKAASACSAAARAGRGPDARLRLCDSGRRLQRGRRRGIATARRRR